MIIDKQQAREICQRALSHVTEGQAEAIIYQYDGPLTRIANNVIHQNVDVSNIGVSLRVDINDRSGRSTTNQVDEESLKKLARRSIEAAKTITIKQDLPPMVGPQVYRDIPAFAASTAVVDPLARAEMVEQAVALARDKGALLAGIVNNFAVARAMANTNGLFAYHCQSYITMELTARADGSAGRWTQSVRELSELNPREIARKAIDKCLGSRDPRALDPGDFTVILEPDAVTTPLMFLSWLAFGAQAVQEGTSCLTGKIGQKLMGGNITIADDAYNPLLVWAEPFDSEGMARQRVTIIDKGVVKGPVYDIKTAAKDGKASTGHGLPQPNTYGPVAQNLTLSGGEATVDSMVASTKRGILVTRFWYNRVVDQKVPIITGMTRDGTFLIEDGKIVSGLKNMRFNQDLVEFFNNVEMLGLQESAMNMAVPALKINNFHFTGRTE